MGTRATHPPRGRTGAAVDVLPPDLGALPAVVEPARLDDGQRAALETFLEGRDVLAEAGPGAGRTVLALAAAAQLAAPAAERPVVLLAPRRAASSRLQDALALAGAAGVRSMTAAALAHAVLRARALAAGQGEPSLVTGAEQDALLAELIAVRGEWALRIDPTARTLPGFRTELRDLFTRLGDLGLSPDELEDLGRRNDRAAWHDAAGLLRDYLGVLDLSSRSALDAGPRWDSGRLVRQAAEALGTVEDAVLPWALVVDDAQDLTAAGIDLVAACARRGVPLLITHCPDLAVDTFRGALPDAVARLEQQLDRPVHRVVLSGTRIAPAVLSCADALRARLPLAGAGPDTRRPRPAVAYESAPTGVCTLTAPTALDEARMIAAAVRDAHHSRGVAYDDMAVVCRSGTVVEEIAEQLTRCGLPVHTPQRLGPLHREPVVADLLTVVEIAAELGAPGAVEPAQVDAVLSPETAEALLRGPFGDADALRLRRIRRQLLDAARAEAPETGTPEDGLHESGRLLAQALLLEEMPGLPGAAERDRFSAPVHRLRAMITAARARLQDGAPDVLWAAWDAAGLATGWQYAALQSGPGPEGARARLIGRRLDALVALFAATDRFAERRPQADARVLVDHLRSQSVPEDSLAASASVAGRVAVLTPAQIAGTHRDTVVMARLQEGSWPNLRLRSTLFGTAELSLLAGRGVPRGDEEVLSPAALRAVLREQVLADEIRWAVTAMTRARSRVLVTAVDGGDETPSALFEAIAETAQGGWIDLEALRSDPGPAPDPRQLVAALRRDLAGGAEERARQAAVLLAALGAARAPGTDPDRWYHQHPSSSAPLRVQGQGVTLSPSALERAHECPHAWLLQRAGGTRPPAPAQLIGTALHTVAEQFPSPPPGSGPDLLARFETLLRPLERIQDFSTQRRREQARTAVGVLADYLETAPAPLAVEAPFDVTLGEVRLRGTIDRIEGDENGLRVVDLKTGRSAKSAKDAELDLQLAAYQAAVREGALADVLGEDAPQRLLGASLVYVGTGTRRASVRTQGALQSAEEPRWFDELVQAVGEEVSGSHVTARRNRHCDRCPVRSSCPLQPEGGQL